MNSIITAAFSRSRVVSLLLTILLAWGAFAYIAIPKEANPEIPLPLVYVSTSLDGISPVDSERLLVEPLESEFATIAGLDKMEGHASEGFASIRLEFQPGFDADEALDRVREAVDRAASELPTDAADVTITEVNTALFPIINAVLSGPVPE